MNVRVRFAPSPTGYLHIGGLRTALYNYLFARKMNGAFVLRIEDTDRARGVNGAIENLIETLRWAGLDFDEGPEKGGSFGPYMQSERLALYRAHAKQLVEAGNAYYAFETIEELEAMRRTQEQAHAIPKYDRRALTLSPEEVAKKIAAHVPAAIRMKVPDDSAIEFDDIIRGHVAFSSNELDDSVLLKSDGYPTYHLANVVDDHYMKITHVIRGEEWLPSVPKHILLYKYFGWELPRFAHLPLLLNSDKSKLSKRQGDVAVEEYRKKGYTRDALINFVAFLGWNPGSERELFSLEDLVHEFSFERVQKSGAVFNIQKLEWFNAAYIKKMSHEELVTHLRTYVPREWLRDEAFFSRVVAVERSRIKKMSDFSTTAFFFFALPEYESELLLWNKTPKEKERECLRTIRELLNSISHSQCTKEFLDVPVMKVAEERGRGEVLWPLRVALSGQNASPGPLELLDALGKEESLKRIDAALAKLST